MKGKTGFLPQRGAMIGSDPHLMTMLALAMVALAGNAAAWWAGRRG
jgi:hypothetical protein